MRNSRKVLFDSGMAHTQRLKDILARKIYPTRDDLLELWSEFAASSMSYAGERATLKDFGEWISGTGSFAETGACICTW
jgi:hypothetical protein